ncbi:Tigger transposable element-derived protein 1 [Araneus ventricosus]|uniref:Tigger transposable element-derived protein 1 n=1 Tax=Araneus ventricosus TaxID=182803 RepID=A0A4Y2LSJ6_ARAVE|nr:Tigger transposable element-derived protein 1 [Araneus ventricosus]
MIFADILKKKPGSSKSDEKFEIRTGIVSVVGHVEAASSDDKIEENIIAVFKKLLHFDGHLPKQVFNCVETALFWKKTPKRIYIIEEENALPGHKRMKHELTLLFCSNASGNLKIKPLLVYRSETPREVQEVLSPKEQAKCDL